MRHGSQKKTGNFHVECMCLCIYLYSESWWHHWCRRTFVRSFICYSFHIYHSYTKCEKKKCWSWKHGNVSKISQNQKYFKRPDIRNFFVRFTAVFGTRTYECPCYGQWTWISIYIEQMYSGTRKENKWSKLHRMKYERVERERKNVEKIIFNLINLIMVISGAIVFQ